MWINSIEYLPAGLSMVGIGLSALVKKKNNNRKRFPLKASLEKKEDTRVAKWKKRNHSFLGRRWKGSNNLKFSS